MSAELKPEAPQVVGRRVQNASDPRRRGAIARLHVALWPLVQSGHVYVQVFAAQIRDGLEAGAFPSSSLSLDFTELFGLLEEIGGYEAQRAALRAAWQDAVATSRAALA